MSASQLTNKKKFSEYSEKEKKTLLIIMIPFMMAVVGITLNFYLCTLQLSLKFYPAGLKWVGDIMVHPEKLNSIAYMIYGFLFVLLILGFPFMFIASFMMCLLLSTQWKEKSFCIAFFFPGIFAFVTFSLSMIGHSLV